jgi:hypothetical protein
MVLPTMRSRFAYKTLPLCDRLQPFTIRPRTLWRPLGCMPIPLKNQRLGLAAACGFCEWKRLKI